MDKLHVLLVCPDGTDFLLLKQTGTLALALTTCNVKISLIVGGVNASPLDGLVDRCKIVYAPARRNWPAIWRDPLAHTLKKCLDSDDTIDIVHVADVAWPASNLAPIAAKLQMPVVGRLIREEDIAPQGLNFLLRNRHQKNLHLFRPLIVSASHLLETAKKAELNNLALIPEGINTDHFKPVLSKRPIRRQLGLPEKACLICCMAAIEPNNRQLDTLRQCLPLSEERQLLLIGDVTDKTYGEKIAKEATAKGVAAYVHFMDAVDNPEEYLKASDVFMLMGGIEKRHSTILEAQSAGLPVVLAPSPSALMLTNGNRCGVVLYPKNKLATKAFDKLLSDATYRQGRAINTRPYVQKEFPFKKMIQSYVKLYNSL